MEAAKLTILEGEGSALLVVEGDFDLRNAAELENAIAQAAKPGRTVDVDLRGCTYLDSTVLTALVRQHNALGDALAVVLPSQGHVRRIFETTGLASVLRVVDPASDFKSA